MEKMTGSDIRERVEFRRNEISGYEAQIAKLQKQIDMNNQDIATLQGLCSHEWEKVFPEAVLKTCKFCGLVR